MLKQGSADNSVCFFDISGINSDKKGILLQKIVNFYLFKEEAHEEDINCVAFHQKKNILASCSDDNTIKIWVGK